MQKPGKIDKSRGPAQLTDNEVTLTLIRSWLTRQPRHLNAIERHYVRETALRRCYNLGSNSDYEERMEPYGY
ncbi:hypothetical protein M1O57_03210 [Dehalococcoidia bacterium]|nr:hypothetical protein [Dehalococcoidia bacterium]